MGAHPARRRPRLRPHARDAVEFGYRVFVPHRRKGYAAEAAAAAMAWARTHFATTRFVASVSPGNAASLALIAHLGFTMIGQQVDDIDGIEHIYMGEIPASRPG